MAAHIESRDVKALPVLPYPALRAQLQSGDLFLASGDYLLSKAIQKVTDRRVYPPREALMVSDSLASRRINASIR